MAPRATCRRESERQVARERLNKLLLVIPAKAGIQCLRGVIKSLDPGFRRDDGLFRHSLGHPAGANLVLEVDRPRWFAAMVRRALGATD
ncbi:MAG: hypothetical protein EPN49_13895 [Rhodanobacter sp.]|nr:MAG: hypothetical protein EPN49_13895 [Rhodanobacter sp.]